MRLLKHFMAFILTMIAIALRPLGNLAAAAAMVLAFTSFANAEIVLRVDGASGSAMSANPQPDGSAWGAPAYRYLADAIKEAKDHEPDPYEIWVRAGTYYPDEGDGLSNNSRLLTFQMLNNVKLYGGFAGGATNETLKNQRNPLVNISILSGEIQQDSDIDNNSYHVVTGELLEDTAVIDGFTIKLGNADGEDVWVPTCSGIDCPPQPGGCDYGLDPALDGKIGGGMLLLGVPEADCGECQPLVMRCTFEDNRAGKKGGGVYYAASEGSRPVFSNCVFIGNIAATAGGGFADDSQIGDSEVKLINCLFHDNKADDGGAVWMEALNGLKLINCTVADNVTTSTAAVSSSEACTGPGLPRLDILHLVNTIVFDNTDGGSEHEGKQIAGLTIIDHCCIEGFDDQDPDTFCREVGEETNTADDPLFNGIGDYHLASNSTLIDAGLSTEIESQDDPGDIDQDGNFNDIVPDLGGATRISSPQGCTVDIGAYEYQATMTCHGDIDHNCHVDVDDLIAVILQWGTCSQPCSADVSPSPCNPDGVVDVDDLIAVIIHWTGEGLCEGCTATGQGAGADPESYADCQQLCMEYDGERWVECMQSCFWYLCNEKAMTEFCNP